MRILISAFFALFVWNTCSILAQPRTISNDAIVLTLQEQSGILLDSTRAFGLDSSLRLVGLGNFYRGISLNTVEVEFASTNTLFVQSWFLGKIATGNSRVDSVSRLLGLISVEPRETYTITIETFKVIYHRVRLQFYAPLHDIRAYFAYQSVGASFNSFDGALNRIFWPIGNSGSFTHFRCNNTEHFIQKSGSGDCQAGCINTIYYYAAVQQTDTGKVVTREPSYSWGADFAPPYNRPQPRTIPYNVPQWYSVTQFGTADSLIKALKHPVWWVQNHAIQGLWRVFVSATPIDLDNWNLDSARLAQWAAIRQGVLSRKAEITQTLLSARNTAVCGVDKSIDTALARIATVGVREAAFNNAEKITVSPNPFSDEVRIVATLPTQTRARISIVNMLGKQIATVFEGFHNGNVDVLWSDALLPSGVYIVQVFANGQLVSCSRLVRGK